MKFGLFTLFDFFADLQNERDYFRDTIALLKEAEALGYDSVWVGEEHFYSFGICPNPQMFLAALARETTTMRLGTAISVLPLEHPLRKAEEFALLDQLSNGRADFGAGTGGIPKHFAGFGIDPSEKRDRYEESLEVIEKAWRNKTFSHEGKFWNIPEISVSPRPVQTPCIPIYRGVLGLVSFTVAGTKGHSIQVPPWMAQDNVILQGIKDHRAALKAHGHTHVADPVFMFSLYCSNDYKSALAEARTVVLRYRDLLASNFPLDAGKILPPGDSMRDLYDMLTTTEEHFEERVIVGTPAQCRRRIAELRDKYSAEHMGFYLHAGARNIDSARKSLRLFADEVMPEFKTANTPANSQATIRA